MEREEVASEVASETSVEVGASWDCLDRADIVSLSDWRARGDNTRARESQSVSRGSSPEDPSALLEGFEMGGVAEVEVAEVRADIGWKLGNINEESVSLLSIKGIKKGKEGGGNVYKRAQAPSPLPTQRRRGEEGGKGRIS